MKLIYYDCWGRAEVIRYVLAVAGIEYEDVRFSIAQWEEYKAKTPYSVCPLLEVDGEIIDQSMAIVRYVAREAGLDGKTNWEKAQADQMAGTVYDVWASTKTKK